MTKNTGNESFSFILLKGKPLFEMCWFYMGIAQIALGPSPSVKRRTVEKIVPQTILASIYTPLPYGQYP